jgi:hypothetical protein
MARNDTIRNKRLSASLRSAIATAAIVGTLGGWVGFSSQQAASAVAATSAVASAADTSAVASAADTSAAASSVGTSAAGASTSAASAQSQTASQSAASSQIASTGLGPVATTRSSR